MCTIFTRLEQQFFVYFIDDDNFLFMISVEICYNYWLPYKSKLFKITWVGPDLLLLPQVTWVVHCYYWMCFSDQRTSLHCWQQNIWQRRDLHAGLQNAMFMPGIVRILFWNLFSSQTYCCSCCVNNSHCLSSFTFGWVWYLQYETRHAKLEISDNPILFLLSPEQCVIKITTIRTDISQQNVREW